VNNKYDQWHKDILNKFGVTIADNMREFHLKLQKARRKLETLSIDGSEDVAMFVTEIQEMQPNFEVWARELEKFKGGHKLLVG
jgi:dynein heavy chain 1